MPQRHIDAWSDIPVRSAIVVQVEVAPGDRVLVDVEMAASVEVDVRHPHERAAQLNRKDLLERSPVGLLAASPFPLQDRSIAHEATLEHDALQDQTHPPQLSALGGYPRSKVCQTLPR